MTDIPNSNWYSMSDKALSQVMGTFVRHHRLNMNLSQSEVAQKANISRSTLSLLERGETVTVATLIQVLRTLELLFVMDGFKIEKQLSPIALAKLQKEERQRARSRKEDQNKESDW